MLDPSRVQVLVAELQEGIIDLSRTNEPTAIRRSARVLTQVAHLLDIPVTATAAPIPGGGPTLIDELTGCAGPFVRGGPSGWDDPALRQAILDQHRPVLALGGVTSEIVVLHTALGALSAGLEVHVLVDLCGGLTARTEQAAFRQIEAAGGTLTSVVSLTTDMVRDFTDPVGGEVIAALHTAA